MLRRRVGAWNGKLARKFVNKVKAFHVLRNGVPFSRRSRLINCLCQKADRRVFTRHVDSFGADVFSPIDSKLFFAAEIKSAIRDEIKLVRSCLFGAKLSYRYGLTEDFDVKRGDCFSAANEQ